MRVGNIIFGMFISIKTRVHSQFLPIPETLISLENISSSNFCFLNLRPQYLLLGTSSLVPFYCSKERMGTIQAKVFILVHLFLVGVLLGKSARLLQWLVFFSFFRQTTDLIAYVPLFTETDKTTQAKSGQCQLSAKGPPFITFFM